VKPVSSLKDYLMKPKDRLPTVKQTGVVYSIPCKDCEVEYIRETGRAFGTRKNEHYRSKRLAKTGNSA